MQIIHINTIHISGEGDTSEYLDGCTPVWGKYVRTKITEVNLSAFVYRPFHEDFSPIIGTNLDLF